jgi:tetratricopeptide (TPR) repeat protein
VFGPTGPPAGSESLEKFQAFAEREKRVLVAQDHRRAALDAQPDLLEARLRLGRLASYLGREGEALEELTPVASGKASREMRLLAQLFLGRVHEQAGRVPVAIRSYRRALEIDPTSQTAAIGLSYALGRSGERGQGAEVLRPALLARRTSEAWIDYHLGFPSNYEAAMRSLREKVRP